MRTFRIRENIFNNGTSKFHCEHTDESEEDRKIVEARGGTIDWLCWNFEKFDTYDAAKAYIDYCIKYRNYPKLIDSKLHEGCFHE